MLILVNLTGLSRYYWLPSFTRATDREGLWYFCVRWLGVEITVYSRLMAIGFIKRMSGKKTATRLKARLSLFRRSN